MRYPILSFLLILSCAPNPKVPQKKYGADQDYCGPAAVNLAKLFCPNGQGGHYGDPNKHGESFLAICEELYKDNVDIKAPCLAAATSCTEVDQCRP